jgi:SWI/SNF-related matrix-associated actin-dependent regulator 1 of chromatin subfamily A
MRIDFHDGEFIVSCTFEERFLAKKAGYKWDALRKKWVTRSTGLAVIFGLDKLTDAARKACGLDQELRPPDGLEYLEFQKGGIKWGLEHLSALIADQPGLGKGHPHSTRIRTPQGWRAIGDLKHGDLVIGWEGKPIPVTGIFDRGVLPVYTVSFSDGAVIQCDADHLWTVCGAGADARLETIDTLELMGRINRGEDLAIPTLLDPAESEPKSFNVPPLTAGTDLASDNAKCNKRFIYPEKLDYELTDYAEGAAWQSLDFLRGIILTAGRVDGAAIRVKWFASPLWNQIERTVTACVRKVGGLTLISRRKQNCHVMRIYLPDHVSRQCVGVTSPARDLSGKWRAWTPQVPRRRVVSIIPFGTDFVRCIKVNGPGSLYVADHYIVTHNTIQAVGVMNALPHLDSALIIPPASLKPNWLREIKKWGTKKHLSVDIADGKNLPKSDIVIINPDVLAKHRDALRRREWGIIIPDEAHGFKNPEAGRTIELFGGMTKEFDATKKRKVKFRLDPIPKKRLLMLTGTPLANKPGDMWVPCRECDPLGLGSLGRPDARSYSERMSHEEAFHRRFAGGYSDTFGFVKNGTPNEQELKELNKLLKQRFMIRRLKADVLTELPEKIRQIVPLPADGMSRKMQAEKDAFAELMDAYEIQTGIRREMAPDEMVNALMTIRPETWETYAEQCGGDFNLAETPLTKLARIRQDLALAKLPMVVEYVQNLIDQDEKVVVFAYHQAVIEALAEHFRGKNSFGVSCIYGKTPQVSNRHPERTRQAQADAFQNDPNCRLIIGQYIAMGTGWTLTNARHNVFAELTWVPHELLQAEDRIHRIGSEIWDSVHCHHLVVQGSMDDVFVEKLIEKMRIIELALD